MNAEIGGEPASKKESMDKSTVFNIGLTIDHIRHLRDANEGSISEVGKSIFLVMEARCKAYDLLKKLDKERQAARKVEIAEAEAVELLGAERPGCLCGIPASRISDITANTFTSANTSMESVSDFINAMKSGMKVEEYSKGCALVRGV